MSELELLKQEIIRLKEDLLKQKQQLEEENELLKKQLETKNNKVEIVDLEKALLALQRNFSAQWDLITNDLKLIYLNESGDAFKRRSFQLSQLGIIWSENLNLAVWKTEEKEKFKILLQGSVTLIDSVDYWSRIEDSAKIAILEWMQNFRRSSLVKPEALISGNLWGFILRKILLSIEGNCNVNHNNQSMLQCFGEYNIGSLKSMGTSLSTDYVFTAGCRGLPLLLVELQASRKLFRTKKPSMHKDLKKISVQMSAVLFEKIGMIRKSSGDTMVLSSLRVFGLLIFDTHVEYFMSRPVIQEDGKFFIIFEKLLNQVDHDMYLNQNYEEFEDEPDPNLDSDFGV